ncbi:MAG: nicotinate-nucleotide--dimethylbenzimidazole phosphoribosyltransferase [Bacteroidota bacterium]|nr:nicotinate-nucleotide--dimethylbenzimidazole phosphoribosyltransferase [Bacteroidota bacterium]MDP4246166.1 nicotinate-nucleotide--dimethylbenzimidazole phosphoribosyltransferase [Bacteroidota bacterium]MDP4253973.1 nicotinate-nucleotide--dimethylbenzimidazole phosphoribosyltransferase [Bacteroidota bacterium]MDP4257991.1 nicotinate-nucleotide--dimethylbenzimidazole phosphoribosyltransferase [Bacteroidota bacterium]
MNNFITTTALQTELQHKIDNKTKPIGALGVLEDVALSIGLIQGTLRPALRMPHIIVFAADHGIAATGLVNPYPQAVTAQMVLNFIGGGAAINVFCRQHDIGLTIVDAGVNADFGDMKHFPRFIDAKMGYGTQNYLDGEAMSSEQMWHAIEEGKKIVQGLYDSGCNCIGLGEMGIGNTSSAALVMSFLTGIPIEDCVGRGTGVNEDQLKKKMETLVRAFGRHRDRVCSHASAAGGGLAAGGRPTADPYTILQCVGGFEIAMMTGAYLRAAELRMVVLVDGFITTAALLLARAIESSVQDCCLFTHASGEQGHEKMLRFLGVRPLLNLGMRLGEGTGAAMAFPIVQSAVHFLNEMASFESAGVSNKE